jgi:hypothetical protein
MDLERNRVGGLDWILLAQDKDLLWYVQNMVMYLLVSYNSRDFWIR